jgi:hypothetical protein
MPADVGNQEVTLKFYDPAASSEVNARFKDIRQLGIYKGGRLSIVDNTHASISPLVCEISDGTHQIKVETTIAVTLTVAEATPHVVLRWTYVGLTSDFMEILVVATPSANDLVVGKCSFGGGALQGFTYGDSSYPRSTPNTQELHLKVEPTEATELKVRIRAGRVQNSEGYIDVIDQKSNIFVLPSSDSKVYLVYVDRLTGNILIDDTGTEAASPVAPEYGGKMVLAEITLDSTDTNITSDKIKDVREFLSNKIGFVVEGRTSDPSNPGTGQVWLRTDL